VPLPFQLKYLTNASIECNTGIIAASLPCLKPLFRHILDKSLRSDSNSRGYGKDNNTHSLRTFNKGTIPGTQNHNSITSTYITSKRTTALQPGDLEENSSEENILFQGNAITKTTVVTVDNVDVLASREGSERKVDIGAERKIKEGV